MALPIIPLLANAARSAGTAAVRVGAGLARSAAIAARGAVNAAGNLASNAGRSVADGGRAAAGELGSMAKGAASAARYVATTGPRVMAMADKHVPVVSNGVRQVGSAANAAANSVRSAASAAIQSGQQAGASVQQTAQSAVNSIQNAARQASQSIQQLAQQLLNVGSPGGGGSSAPGGGGGNRPPGGNAPPAGNNPPGRGGGGQGPIGNFVGNQLRSIARQAAGTAIGQSVAQGMSAVRILMRYGGPMGGINAAKDAATAGVSAVSWLSKLPGRLKDFGDSLVKAREHLTEYNGSLAAAAAKLEVERIGRNIRLGAATAKSGSYQTAAQSRLENATLPMQALMANITNGITGALQNTAAWVVETLPTATITAITVANPGLGTLLSGMKAAVAKYMTEEAGRALPLHDFIKDLGDGKFLNRRGPPIGRGP